MGQIGASSRNPITDCWNRIPGHPSARSPRSTEGARQSFAAAANSLASLVGAGPEPKSDLEGRGP